jgi:hypothetical protein
MRSTAFTAPHVPNFDSPSGCGYDSSSSDTSGSYDEHDPDHIKDGVDFLYKPQAKGRTEFTVTVEPKKQPWLNMMRFGFHPMINCVAPPAYLTPSSNPGIQIKDCKAKLVKNAYQTPDYYYPHCGQQCCYYPNMNGAMNTFNGNYGHGQYENNRNWNQDLHQQQNGVRNTFSGSGNKGQHENRNWNWNPFHQQHKLDQNEGTKHTGNLNNSTNGFPYPSPSYQLHSAKRSNNTYSVISPLRNKNTTEYRKNKAPIETKSWVERVTEGGRMFKKRETDLWTRIKAQMNTPYFEDKTGPTGPRTRRKAQIDKARIETEKRNPTKSRQPKTVPVKTQKVLRDDSLMEDFSLGLTELNAIEEGNKAQGIVSGKNTNSSS